jgi:cell division protein FtsW
MLIVVALIGIGLVQVYSSSFIFAIDSRGDGLFFFRRQLVFAGIALAVMIATAYIPLRLLERAALPIWLAAGGLVLATLIPGFGARAGGASRWLNLPGHLVFEPSEVLKICLCILLAAWVAGLARPRTWTQWGLRLVLLAVPLLALLKQPDLGTFAITGLVVSCILFVAGLSWVYFAGAIAILVPIVWTQIVMVPWRMKRVQAFLDPWADPEGKGFQVISSMMSFQSGGIWGVGLGEGQGKLFFLPEAHTDFTMAVFGEEMGYIGFLFVMALYCSLVIRGLRLSARADDSFQRYLALGLSLVFACGVIINTGVVIGLLPTKGLTLPFLSYGGSSLVANGILFGLLLNIERTMRRQSPLLERLRVPGR